MFTRTAFIQLVLPIALVAGPIATHASPPVSIEIEAPFANDDQPLLDERGWELLLELTVKDEDVLGFWIEPNFANREQTNDMGYLVFDDPDGCFSLFNRIAPSICIDLYGPDIMEDPSLAPRDETYIEFDPDIDQPGVPDFQGNPDLRDLLTDSEGSGSPFFAANIGGSSVLVPVGPYTGIDKDDGYGFGVDDDLPGLVLLLNAGPGIAYPIVEAAVMGFTQPEPLVLRNLAGLVTSVSYELSDYKTFPGRGRKSGTTIEVSKFMISLHVPANLVRNILAIDNCVGGTPESWACNDAPLYRRDGSDLQESGEVGQTARQLAAAVLEETELELIAYMVSGTAKAQLEDLNDDGKVNIDDAHADPEITVLSDQASITVSQFESFACGDDGNNFFLADLDGNGMTTEEACP